MNKLTLPNLLSGIRLALALPSAWFTWQQQWSIAAVLLLIAVATDFLDGWVARRNDQVSAFGGLLDHASDAIFVTATLAGLAGLGVVPMVLPFLVAIAFSQYVLDSNALAGQPLRASQLGRYNGIAYFVLAGFPILQAAIDIPLVPVLWFYRVGWLLVATT
ncbi:MAG: CDP-alcohol phosphatidyltransferase family protein, partial [Pseudomonadales bacterium]|nr:CDP-alcohol phosphatidyltransferase family protein [Pseudomonadales bacterium]